MKRILISGWFKSLALGGLAIMLLLLGVLAWHIYDVTHKPRLQTDFWQMARIEFTAPLDSNVAGALRYELHKQPAVKHSFVNLQEGVLVFACDLRQTNPRQVYANIRPPYLRGARLRQVTATEMASACPITDKGALSYKLSQWFKNAF